MCDAYSSFRLLTYKMKVMRKIDSIIVHCSATKAGLDFSAADIDRWHRERGFNDIGYHYIVCLDGKIEKGRDILLMGAHCKGWNERSIGICYIGGLDENGLPADTRTNAQKRVLYQLIMDLQKEYGILQVLGHRDTSPDLNGDGVVEPYEYVKSCPCFNVKEFMRNGRELLFVLLAALFVSLLTGACKSGKEISKKRQQSEMDSSSVTSSEKSVAGESLISKNDSKITEEYMERTECLFSLDTLGRSVGVTMVKVVTGRKNEKERMISMQNRLMQEDSVYMKSQTIEQSQDEMNSVIHKKDGFSFFYNSLIKAIFLLFGLLASYLINKRITKLYLRNS